MNVSCFGTFDLIESYVVPFEPLALMLACDLFHKLDEIVVDYLWDLEPYLD